jgi:DHA2 family multidrug resistance protein
VLFLPLLVSGFSIAFMFVPLQTLAFGSLKPEQMANASGIFNLMRNVGGSVGIALITTLSTRFAQARQTTLVAHLTPYDTSYQSAVSTASSLFAAHGDKVAAHGDKVAAQQQTLGSLYHQLLTQANFLAYLDIFRWFVPLCLVCAIGALILKNVKIHGPMAVH